MVLNTESNTFVPLHVHSMYSRLQGGDGLCFPRELAQRAHDIGCPAIALTDHGTMAGLAEFYSDCTKIGIKPILGMEAYITPIGHSRFERERYDIKDMRGKSGYIRNNYHLILLAKNETGYENLCNLSKQSYAQGFYYKPRIDHELLKENSEGLICTSACILGAVANLLWCDDYESAIAEAVWYQEVFGDDYYLEVMNHGLDMELKALPKIRELADLVEQQTGKKLKVIATNDSHYAIKGEHKLHKALMLDSMHKSFGDADVSGSFFNDDDSNQKSVDEDGGDSNPIFETASNLYIKDYNEMVETLSVGGGEGGVIQEELANTLEIADKCNFELPIIDPTDMSAYHTPIYPVERDLQYDAFKESGFEIKDSTAAAIIKEMKADGRQGEILEDFLNEHEMLSLRFLMWMCDKGLKENVIPKLEARGEALPMEYWCENPPEGLEIIHTHNSPDELWIKEQIENGSSVEDMLQVYQDRVDYEISVIARKGFIDYFSIVQNYANFTKMSGSIMGPGRGSGGGSLLLYLLSITSIDPIPNKLLFFRFLNPDRKGYPDVDLDWSAEFRDNKLKPYLRKFYGEDRCAGISTYMYYWGKAAIRAAARVLFVPPESVEIGNILADALDDKPKLDLNSELDGSNPAFQALVNSSIKYKQTVELALQMQGRLSGESIHASAFIVSPDPLIDKIPLTVSKAERQKAQKEGTEITEYLIAWDGVTTQDVMGYVKLDLLCVVDLEMMELTCRTIEKIYGAKLDLEKIPLDDGSVWTMLNDHLVSGIFQLDGSAGMAEVMEQIKPQSIEHINAIVALYRPGPMDYIPNYIDGKNHPDDVHYLDPRLEPILKDTYGTVVYQEESMQITQAIGNFTGGEADAYRKAAAKKHPEQLVPMGEKFIQQAIENNTDKAVAEELWEQLVKFGAYAFNRCLTGDTTLHIAEYDCNGQAHSSQDISIFEILQLFDTTSAAVSFGAETRNEHQHKILDKGLFISCHDADGRCRSHKVKNIFEQGEHDVYLIELANGKHIKATLNHRFQVADGSYQTVNNFSIGDELWCCDFENATVFADNGIQHRQNANKEYAAYLSPIISISYAGREMTYDIEIESDEHNFFANGICSHNSHSAAYALIAYRGAFLKAHFPDCFFAALCTLKPKAKKTNKVPEYLEEARAMGITIKPPHVNYSMSGFDVPSRGVISFGLGGIKSVGHAADEIIAEREANGPFKDFTDFCCRVPKTVTKTAIKQLIEAGAIDGLGWSRKAMKESIEQIIEFRKKWFEEQEKLSQFEDSLFGDDMFGEANENDYRIDLIPPFDTEYTPRQILHKEKELFEMYFSGSPEDYSALSRYCCDKDIEEAYAAARKNGTIDNLPRPINISDVPNMPDKTRVEFTAIVEDIRPFKSGKGASIFIKDWGKKEASRFGFAPAMSRSKLTCFERVWINMPRPLPDDVVHVIGRISVDPDGKFPTSIAVDSLEILPEDADIIGKRNSELLTQRQSEMMEMRKAYGDPSSNAYLIPAISFKSETDLSAFLFDPDIGRFRGEGRVQLSVIGTDAYTNIHPLRQTRGMVALATRYGGIAAKIRLPKAQTAIDRRAMMNIENGRPNM